MVTAMRTWWSWYEVVWRPSTDEYFKLRCWDGVSGGYTSDLDSVDPPDDVILDKVA